MTIYLSGGMSFRADTDYNYPAFNAVAHVLRERGYTVLNPAENFSGDASHPRKDYMRLDIQHVLNADALVVLPGWEDSKGASLEVAIARELELPIYEVGAFLTSSNPTAVDA